MNKEKSFSNIMTVSDDSSAFTSPKHSLLPLKM